MVPPINIRYILAIGLLMIGAPSAEPDRGLPPSDSTTSNSQTEATPQELPQAMKEDGEYRNAIKLEMFKLSKAFGMLKRLMFESSENTRPSTPVPIKHITVAGLQPLPDRDVEITRLGHSSEAETDETAESTVQHVCGVSPFSPPFLLQEPAEHQPSAS